MDAAACVRRYRVYGNVDCIVQRLIISYFLNVLHIIHVLFIESVDYVPFPA